MEIGKVIGHITDTFINIKTYISGWTRKGYQVTPYGFISIPIKGLFAVRSETLDYEIILGYVQKDHEGLNEGECVIFSRDNTGQIKSQIVMKNDGKINITSDDTIDFQNGNLTIEP